MSNKNVGLNVGLDVGLNKTENGVVEMSNGVVKHMGKTVTKIMFLFAPEFW